MDIDGPKLQGTTCEKQWNHMILLLNEEGVNKRESFAMEPKDVEVVNSIRENLKDQFR